MNLRATLPDGIAAQHRHLGAGMRRVRAWLVSGADGQAVASLFDQLLDDVDAHFADEEQVMRDARYPELDEHHLEHVEFAKKVRALRAQCNHGQTELMCVLADLLQAWLETHERTADRRVADYLAAQEP